ncbi:MAG: cation transporter [Synergistaceae bacterium]|nr:cation transporter [Synergistaceae bacterium]
MKTKNAAENREQQIIRVSFTGIITNVVLAGFKFVIGFLANSVAIMIDAVNNASDVLSSVITVIGTKLAGKPANKSHPYGHGRLEYITAEVIAAIVLYAGITALIEAVRKIIYPVEPEYSCVSLIIVTGGIIVKFVLGRYVSSQGEKLSSNALADSGKDALMDAAVSASTLVGALVFLAFNINLEAWLGALISLVIIKAGVDMFSETTSKILGERIDSGLTKSIKASICETQGVFGAYDLILTNYGPDMLMGSVHIEIPDNWTADKIDTVSREIAHRVFTRHHVILAAVGVYSHNSSNSEINEIQSSVTRSVMSHDYVLQIHGFYCDTKNKIIRFDIVIDFAAPDAKAIHDKVLDDVKKLYPDFDVTVQFDQDYSD